MRKSLVIVLLLAVVGVITAARFWNAHAQARKWQELATQRERIAWTRYLPSFQSFLGRQTGSDLRTVYNVNFMGHFKENYMPVHGAVISHSNYKIGGRCWPVFYYQGWQAEPTSAEFRLHLEPWILEEIQEGELKTLIEQTRTKGPQRTKLGDMDWYSRFDEKGELDITLRVAYPARWLDAIPEYDRGFTDEMEFVVSRKALRFLYREVLADKYTPLYMDLPSYNPPGHGWDDPVGTVSGYLAPKNGRLMRLEISTTATRTWSPKVTLHTEILPHGQPSMTAEEGKKLLKPEVVKRIGQAFEEGLMIYPMYDRFEFRTSCPYDFDIENAQLSKLTPVAALR